MSVCVYVCVCGGIIYKVFKQNLQNLQRRHVLEVCFKDDGDIVVGDVTVTTRAKKHFVN